MANARGFKFLNVLCVLVLVSLWNTAGAASKGSNSNAVVETLKCHLPNSTIMWDPRPDTKTVDVHWKYGPTTTCHESMDCYQVENVTTNSHVTSSVGVQLRPVQLQSGNKLRFTFKRYVSGAQFHIYKVNATAFSSCNASMGKIVRKDNGSDVFELPSESLDFGHNYFIVATNYSTFTSCELGLRLNVTVKTETCTGNHSVVCGGRGMCTTNKHQDHFACQCCGTYKGDNCSIFDACLSYPCENGGECVHGNGTAKNASLGYQCKCAIGYNGTHCEQKVRNLCDLVRCQNGGTCTGNATSFNCSCMPGWTGSQCEVDINDCDGYPCRHGHCVDRVNGFNCSCYPGYYGERCELQRTSCKFSPCRNGGFCENQTTTHEFKYACHCPPGWNGTDCSQRVSPCEPNPCTSRGLCIEHYDRFQCACQPGFDGHRCEVNINDCDPNPCLWGGQCYDMEQGHLCRCVHTHYGDNCQYSIGESGYYPPLSGGMTHVIVIRDGNGDGNGTLTAVCGVVTAGVVLVILLLAAFYYRSTKESSGTSSACGLTRIFGGKKPSSDLTVQVNVNNTPDRPLTSDSFFQGSRSQSDLGLDNKAFQNEVV